jgi:hypothetical protein
MQNPFFFCLQECRPGLPLNLRNLVGFHARALYRSQQRTLWIPLPRRHRANPANTFPCLNRNDVPWEVKSDRIKRMCRQEGRGRRPPNQHPPAGTGMVVLSGACAGTSVGRRMVGKRKVGRSPLEPLPTRSTRAGILQLSVRRFRSGRTCQLNEQKFQRRPSVVSTAFEPALGHLERRQAVQ